MIPSLPCAVSIAVVPVSAFRRNSPTNPSAVTFQRNHAPDIAAMDLFVVPTIGFDLLYVFVIVRLARRDLVWINVTPNPTAEWVARQITEAFPWAEAPRYLIRDRDRVYGAVVTRRAPPPCKRSTVASIVSVAKLSEHSRRCETTA